MEPWETNLLFEHTRRERLSGGEGTAVRRSRRRTTGLSSMGTGGGVTWLEEGEEGESVGGASASVGGRSGSGVWSEESGRGKGVVREREGGEGRVVRERGEGSVVREGEGKLRRMGLVGQGEGAGLRTPSPREVRGRAGRVVGEGGS